MGLRTLALQRPGGTQAKTVDPAQQHRTTLETGSFGVGKGGHGHATGEVGSPVSRRAFETGRLPCVGCVRPGRASRPAWEP